MTPEVLLGPWPALPDSERRSIVAAIQVLADREAEAVQAAGLASLTRKPVVDVFAARRDRPSIVVRFFYDFRISHWVQSGSDWDDHHFHVIEAVCRDGAVVSHTITKDVGSIAELDCAAYDEVSASQKRRAAAGVDYWNEWLALPFPFPGDPGPQ